MTDATALTRERYLSLATFRRDGTQVKTPVWFSAVDGKLYVVSAGNAGKVKRLRRSSRALVAASDARGGVRGTWRDATARIITEPLLVDRAHKALVAKYRWQARLLDVVSRLTGRQRGRAWIELELR